MIESIFRSGVVRRRMASSHLGIILFDFVLELHARGHAIATIQSYGQIAEHFSRWLAGRHLPLRRIDDGIVERFLEKHLPQCHCAKPAPTDVRNCRAALHRLLLFLRERGLIRMVASGGGPSVMDALLAKYDRFLHEVAGAAEATRRYRRRYAREFLLTRLSAGRLRLSRLPAVDLRRYIHRRAAVLKPASLRVLTGSLRNFLRFLHLTGRVEGHCADGVPLPAPWPSSQLPATLSKAQVQTFLGSFDRTTETGRRDYAMALCLTRLGLRCREVAGLSLEDIAWRGSTLRLRQTKQRRDRLLPLPPMVARAIADYLRRGRPATAARALFVRHRAPRGEALDVHHVRGAMRRAFARSGTGVTRIHLLRHTFATTLHQKRVGLKAMADILGHQCLDTSARYARVNLKELRQAALPWPERRP